MSELRTQEAQEPIVQDSPPSMQIDEMLDAVRKGLFKDTRNTIITIVFGAIIALVVFRAYGFVFDNQKLTPDGELVNSWRVISTRLQTYMVGTQYPDVVDSFAPLWGAIWLTAFTLGFATGPTRDTEVTPMKLRTRVGVIGPPLLGAVVLLSMTETILPTILTAVIPVAFAAGFYGVRVTPEAVLQRKGLVLSALALLIFLLQVDFQPANVDDFGGLLLTINAAFISIILCFPIGVVMALARRSSFPLIRPIAVGYIELIRGVPLISLLFMGQFALGFFFPPDVDSPPATIRAIIMITLFSAAYVAEIVRGGLQSVPKGQIEAGQAVGLPAITITRRIVLPQALRNSIPPLVGQFIALLKDTTLLIIISQFDLLGVSDPILANPEFQNQGYAPEVYAFVAFIFWIMCFSMSRASQRLETKLGVGTR